MIQFVDIHTQQIWSFIKEHIHPSIHPSEFKPIQYCGGAVKYMLHVQYVKGCLWMFALFTKTKSIIFNHSECNKWISSGFSVAVLCDQMWWEEQDISSQVKNHSTTLVLLNSRMILCEVSPRATMLQPSYPSMYYPYCPDNQTELPFCFHCTVENVGGDSEVQKQAISIRSLR